MKEARITSKVFGIISFIAMVIVKVYANTFSIHGKTTYEILKSYPNLFSPISYSYFILLPISLLFLGFTLYQAGLIIRGKSKLEIDRFEKFRLFFILISVVSTLSTISLHYDFMALSLALLLIVVISLFHSISMIGYEDLSKWDKVFIRLPFSMYFAWVLIEVVIMLVSLLISIGWQSFGVTALNSTIALVLIITILSLMLMFRFRNLGFGLTMIWGLSGILMKHLSPDGFRCQYIEIVVTTAICMASLLAVIICLSYIGKRKI